MKYDRQIIISTGNSRRDLIWKQTTLTVSELYTRLSTPVRGTETLQEYLHFKKSQQDDLKDVGGFVGGALSGRRRKSNNVIGRDIITLDFDNVPGWQTGLIVDKMNELNCSYSIYSTRKHTGAAPRLRVVVPFDRTVTPDEYEPCARCVAAHIGIGMADPTTFEVARLMYWPSCCADSEFVYKTNDAPLMSADFLLGTYRDWHDLTSWPQTPNAVSYQKLAMKQGDPLEKPGIVGAFCRTYDIYSAMDQFLPKIYDATDGDSERFTYLGGSTTGGAVIYDNGKFLFSHHATDPCSGRLVNAFDLVRLHKFGDKDNDAAQDTPVVKLPSYKAMCDMALADKATVATLNREQHEQAMKEFEGMGVEPDDEDDGSWAESLQRTQSGEIKSTINNALIILDGDPLLKDKFALNAFAGRGEVLEDLTPMPDCQIVICKPNFSISTPELFRKLDQTGLRTHPDTAGMLKALEERDLKGIALRMFNVFEEVSDRRMRSEAEIKHTLLDFGAMGAVMTGTGSAVFGVFNDAGAAEDCAEKLQRERLFCRIVRPTEKTEI